MLMRIENDDDDDDEQQHIKRIEIPFQTLHHCIILGNNTLVQSDFRCISLNNNNNDNKRKCQTKKQFRMYSVKS